MEQVAEAEKVTSYETSRTKRSIVDGNMHSDDSNNDDEYASSGFYVREKTNDKKPDSSDTTVRDNQSNSDAEIKENGISLDDNSSNGVVNGENPEDAVEADESKSGENEADCSKNGIEPENDVIEDEIKESHTEENEEEKSVHEKNDDNDVTSSSSNDNETKISSSSAGDDNQVSSTSNNVEDTKTDDKGKEEKSKDTDTADPLKTDEADDNNLDERNDKGDKEDEAKKPKSINEDEAIEVVESETKETEAKAENADNISEKVELKETEKTDDKSDENKDKKVETKDKKEDSDKLDDDIKGKGDDKSGEDKKEKDDKSSEDKKEHGDQSDDKKEEDDSKSTEPSILKEQLQKSVSENTDDMDMDEDFDPSLLCPDISMDVDEAPVQTERPPEDGGSISPLPYEPIFSTLVDEITGAEVQIDLTPEEMEMRQKMFGPDNPVQKSKVHCTACNVHLGSALTGANNRFVHPLLKVLICKNCYHFYTSGEFEKDEDGSELYCRWCGQGGQVLCCSSCEFVFCKRCIRNNFGPKKFREIRESDDWNCFRCDPGQLSNLRAACAEFMEYYRTELARAQSMSATNPELMTTDYTKCCSAPPEKKEEPKPAATPKTRRKRKDEEDPDYHPILETDEPPAKKLATLAGPGQTVTTSASFRPIVPKPAVQQTVARPSTSSQVRAQATGQVFKVGNTTFRPRTPTSAGYTVQRPGVNQGPRPTPTTTTIITRPGVKNASPGYITIPSSGGKSATQGYIKIVPPQQQQQQRMGTASVRPTLVGINANKPGVTAVRPGSGKPNQLPSMKHEWFEKTVRAAARVNSNLSYTLTQLNRQQSQAASVEALAMVHNKLQEVLSTSINSLIQIRKNLRTEFIAGIKNIKFPLKPAAIPPTTCPIVVKDDDDVIFVNPTSASQTQPPPLVLSPAASVIKKVTPITKPDQFSNPKPSTSGVKPISIVSKPAIKAPTVTTTAATGSAPPARGFLKVRSLTALQTVPSECITIPDDPPFTPQEDPLKLPEEKESNNSIKVEIAQDKPENKDVPSTPSSIIDEKMVYIVTKTPSPEVKKMMGACVVLKKSPDFENLLKAQGMTNGEDASDDTVKETPAVTEEKNDS